MAKLRLYLAFVLVTCAVDGLTDTVRGSIPEQEIVFATFPIPLMVESETEGVFIELSQEIIKRMGINARIRVSPPQRSINDLVKGRVDVLFPALDTLFVDDDIYSRTQELIYIKEDFVFTRKGETLLTSIDDLHGKVVGVTRGYPYAREVVRNENLKLDYSLKDEIVVQKLIIGRVEAFIVEEKTGVRAFEKQGVDKLMQYNPALPISRQDVYYATGRNGHGQQLADDISKALKSMKEDGTFEQILSKAEKGLPEK